MMAEKNKKADIQIGKKLQPLLRAYLNNQIYYGRLQSTIDALSSQNRPQGSFGYTCGDFAPATLASNFSLGLITTWLFGQSLNTSITALTDNTAYSIQRQRANINIISLRDNRAIPIVLVQSQVSKWPVISFDKNSEKGGPMKKVPLFLIETCMASKHKQIIKGTGNVPGQVKSCSFTRQRWNKTPGKGGALCQH
ncbi:hypothetical protein ACFL1G_01985 [Planctomycetota bacterium]